MKLHLHHDFFERVTFCKKEKKIFETILTWNGVILNLKINVKCFFLQEHMFLIVRIFLFQNINYTNINMLLKSYFLLGRGRYNMLYEKELWVKQTLLWWHFDVISSNLCCNTGLTINFCFLRTKGSVKMANFLLVKTILVHALWMTQRSFIFVSLHPICSI